MTSKTKLKIRKDGAFNTVVATEGIFNNIETQTSGGPEPSITASQKVWVNKGGNDTTGDGTLAKPFLTIQRAESAITDASPTKTYNINVGTGIYDDSFDQKPWVWVIAEQRRQTTISALATIGLDPSFATAGAVGPLARSGFKEITLNAVMDFDLQALGGTGKVKFEIWHCGINQLLTFRARTDDDSIVIESSFINAGLNGSGGSGNLIINTYVGGDIVVDTVGGATVATLWEMANLYFNSTNLSILSPGNLFMRVTLMNIGFWDTSTLTIGGTITTVYSNGIPLRTQVSFVGGAVDSPAFFIRSTDAFSWAYSPGDPTDWLVSSPFTIQQALDRIAAFIGPVP